MLEAFFAVELAGGPNEEARGVARAAMKLALALHHSRNPDFRTAALCAEGTLSVVAIVAILTGRRDRTPPLARESAPAQADATPDEFGDDIPF